MPDPRWAVSTTSITDAVDELGRLFPGAGISLSRADQEFEYRYTAATGLDLQHVEQSFAARLDAASDDIRLPFLTVAWATEGDVSWERGRQTVDIGRSAAVLYSGDGAVHATADHPAGHNITIGVDPFIRRAAALLGQPFALPTSLAVATADDAALRIRRMLQMAVEQVTLYDEDEDALLAATARDLTVAETLRLFGLDQPTGARMAASRTMRTALAYIHARSAEPITVIDVAEEAGVSARALQTAFRRHLGTSPTEYLRSVRLDAARAQLLEGAPETTSVARVARACGFGHFGRFASAYEERFGELPSVTLRR
jgi:AraC-like DNA-binding protein